MKIISWNVNGIRAMSAHGGMNDVNKLKPDVVCMQEIKANSDQIPDSIQTFAKYACINPAQKKGYSGTALLSKIKPITIQTRLGLEQFDQEGRMIHAHFNNFDLINIYIPHGGREKENIVYKLQVYKKLLLYISKLKNCILLGDLNIAHTELDLARPLQNRDNIMFTVEERKQIDSMIRLKYVDAYRKYHHTNGQYTWWSYGFEARARNLGWRIDYAFISAALSNKLSSASIYPHILGSDHCPIGIDIDL